MIGQFQSRRSRVQFSDEKKKNTFEPACYVFFSLSGFSRCWTKSLHAVRTRSFSYTRSYPKRASNAKDRIDSRFVYFNVCCTCVCVYVFTCLCIIRLTSVSLHNDFSFYVVENVRAAKTGRQKRQQSLPRAKYATFHSHCLRVTISIDRFQRSIENYHQKCKIFRVVLFISKQNSLLMNFTREST